jgi:uncharacterized protein (TIGR02996 family)
VSKPLAAIFWIAASFFCRAVFATAHVPDNDAVVLENLPPAARAADALFAARVAGSTRAVDAASAVAAAKKFVEIGQLYSDPRAYGYAQAALGAWWTASPAPDDVLLMRARILQFRHQFSDALRLLEAALQHDQFNPEGWLMLASIEQVRGNVAASRAACLKLIPISDPLIGTACVTATVSLTAHAKDGDALLAKALAQPTATSPSERAWAWTILAELRDRTATQDAEFQGAEDAFKSALAAQPENVYARAAYSDLLLERGRAHEVRAVLGDATQADALLLRAAIAARIDNDDDAKALADNLGQRFSEAQSRGDETHLREQARFELDVRGDAVNALALASKNFQTQREPADAQLLVDAAIAAHQPTAALPVEEWLDKTGIDAPRLRQSMRSVRQRG